MDLKLKLAYKYEIVLSLANREVKMEQIKEQIEKSVKKYNVFSSTARNVKNISKHVIKENLLFVWLSSAKSLGNPTRGLYLLSQLIMQELEKDGKKDLIKDIVKNKSFLKSVGKAEEVKNIKLENIEVQKNNTKLSLVEAHKIITDVFFNEEIASDEKDKLKEKILELLEEYQNGKGSKNND